MYGSYGSYSSMSTVSAPLDIGPSSYLYAGSSHDSSCAFPSWPRRSSLSESDGERRATSYLSDEDLFPQDVFEDDARSVSSAGSIASPPQVESPSAHHLTEVDVLEMERERIAYQREVVRFLVSEKERRRQAAKKQRKGSASSAKKPKSKLSAIAETGE